MRNLRWQFLIVGVAIFAIAILLVTQRQTQTDGIIRTEGGIYSEGLIGSIGRLNPLLGMYNQTDRDINRLIFSGLIRFDERGNPQPDLVEAWGVSVDGLVYNVTLRENAVWHDSKPVTTADVEFTIEKMLDEDMPTAVDVRNLWQAIELVIFDEQNMQFVLPEPFAPFMDYLSFGIVPKHLLENLTAQEIINDEFNLAPVGSGPFKFEQMLTEGDDINGVLLSAFSDYYQDRSFIEQIVFRYYDSQEQALKAYLEGEIFGISGLSGTVLQEAMADPNLNVYSSRIPKLSMVLFNLDNSEVAFLQEAEVRRALLAGLNREKMIGELMQGQAILADGPIMPGSWAYYENIARIDYDPNNAVSSLKAQGYIISAEGGSIRSKEGILLTFKLVHPDTEQHTAIATAIQKDWERLGVKVDLIAVEYDVLQTEFLDTREYQAALVDLDFTGLPDPDPYPFWHQAEATGGQNYSRWNDRRASEYLERARVSTLIDARIRLYHNFQLHFSQELPALPLFYQIYNYAVDSQVQGVQLGPLFDLSDRFINITEWALVLRAPVEDIPTETP